MRAHISILLAALLCVTALSGCQRNNVSDDTTAPTATSALSGKALDEIVDMIYEKHPMELSLVTVDVALDDAYALKSYTGLDSNEGIREAVASESGFGSQAYSLVLCRVDDPTNAKSVANKMFEGIDQRKWICVTADDLMVSVFSDLILLVMIDSGYAEMATAQQLTDAFVSINGTGAELTLKD